MQVIFS